MVVMLMPLHKEPAQLTAEELFLPQLKLLQLHLHELSGVWPQMTVLHLEFKHAMSAAMTAGLLHTCFCK